MYFGPREGMVPWFESLGALAAAVALRCSTICLLTVLNLQQPSLELA